MLGRVQVPRPPGAQSSREVRAPVPPATSRPGQWVRGLGAKGQGVRGIWVRRPGVQGARWPGG